MSELKRPAAQCGLSYRRTTISALCPRGLASFLWLVVFAQGTNPDVAEPNRVAVILKHKRSFFAYLIESCCGGCLAVDGSMVLHHDAIMENSE